MITYYRERAYLSEVTLPLARDCMRVCISAMGHHVPNLSAPRAAPHGNREPHELDNIKVSFADAIGMVQRRGGERLVVRSEVGGREVRT